MKTAEEIAAAVMNEARAGKLGMQTPQRTEALIANAIREARREAIEACAAVVAEKSAEHRKLADELKANKYHGGAQAHSYYARVLDGPGDTATTRIRKLAGGGGG